MTDLSAFPITRKWPARHPDQLQLYTRPTPNGVKVSIMLEEIGMPYEVHGISLEKQEQLTAEFLSLNPNNKIPAILDPNGPGNRPLALFESGAILFYLAEKTGRFLPADPARRYETMQWLMFQMGGVGPMFGQLGYFTRHAGKDIEDPRPRERFINEVRRLLSVLDKQLAKGDWMMGAEYSIADMAILPWIRTLDHHYQANDLVGYQAFRHVDRALQAFLQRPAVIRGLAVPAM